jgi:hypothetical protein
MFTVRSKADSIYAIDFFCVMHPIAYKILKILFTVHEMLWHASLRRCNQTTLQSMTRLVMNPCDDATHTSSWIVFRGQSVLVTFRQCKQGI